MTHFKKKFSLNWDDGDTESYIVSYLKDKPRRLHEAVASNPLAATRCFHWTAKCEIRTLFDCDDKPGVTLDSIAVPETPEILVMYEPT